MTTGKKPGKKPRIAVVVLGIVVLAAGAATLNREKITRLHKTVTLFDEERIVENFSQMDSMFLSQTLVHSGEVFAFGYRLRDLPATFEFRGKTLATEEFLTRRATTALLVVSNDDITFEHYYLGTTENDQRISWSVAKSFVSALFGVAVRDGLVDIGRPVTDYVPALKGSGYDGATVKDVLQMSSGVGFNEDYGDFHSDINRLGRLLSLGGSLDEFAASLEAEAAPGTRWHYVSIDTHVLAMILRQVTGQTLRDYMQEKLWSKIGVEADGYWITDSEGTAFSLGGLNMRSRDYARFGRLYLNNGTWEGEQVVPQSWVKTSTTADAPHVTGSDERLGYGFQWWLPNAARPGEFLAIGVYGQYIYVNQPEKLVIVKNSADRGFMQGDSMYESIAFFRGVADSF